MLKIFLCSKESSILQKIREWFLFSKSIYNLYIYVPVWRLVELLRDQWSQECYPRASSLVPYPWTILWYIQMSWTHWLFENSFKAYFGSIKHHFQLLGVLLYEVFPNKGRLILLARFFFTLGYGVWCFLLLLYVSYATIPHVTYKEKWFWGECVRLKMSQDLKMNVLYGWVKSYFVSLNNKVAKWLWMTYQTI